MSSPQNLPPRLRWKRLLVLALLVIAALAGLLVALAWTPDSDPAAMKARYGGSPSTSVTLANGQVVHVRDQGPKEALTLVLLHGSNDSLHAWDAWAARLKDSFRVVTLDLPGHGLTGPAPDGDYSIEAGMRAVTGVTNALEIDRFVLGGNSMGGHIAWRYALANPERLEALILVDAGGVPMPAGAMRSELPIGFRLARMTWIAPLLEHLTPRWLIARSLRQSVADPDKVTDAQIDRYWNLLRFPGNRVATIKRFALPLVSDEADRLDQIAVPTLIQWGDQDRLVPLDVASVFRERIPASELVIYPGVGHLPMVEAPEQTVADVITFIGLIQARPPAPPGVMPPPVSDAVTDPALMPADPAPPATNR